MTSGRGKDHSKRERRIQQAAYFGSVVALIGLINTSLPKFVLSALFGPAAGDPLSEGLKSITRDLFVLLLVSIYFEFFRGRRTDQALVGLEGEVKSLRIGFVGEIETLKAELQSETGALKDELSGEVGQLKIKVDELRDCADLEPNSAKLIEEVRRRFSPRLYEIIPQHFDRVAQSVVENIDTGTATLTRVEEFPIFYATTLRQFPDATFCATSFFDDEYLWRNDEVESALHQFLSSSRGGKMKRIFFVTYDENGEVEPAVRATLEEQVAAGVEVYTVSSNLIRNSYLHLYKFMLVDEQRRVLWTYDMSGTEILRVHLTLNPEKIRENLDTFNALRNLRETSLFGP